MRELPVLISCLFASRGREYNAVRILDGHQSWCWGSGEAESSVAAGNWTSSRQPKGIYLVMVGLLVILSVYVFTLRIRNNYIYSIFIENLNKHICLGFLFRFWLVKWNI